MRGGCARAGPVRSQRVIGILAVGHGGQAVGASYFIFYPGEQLVFAVEAAIRAVGPVGGIVRFPGLNLDDAGADDGGDLVCRETFIGPEAGRDAEDGDNLAGAECPHGQGEQDRGVDATGERDAQRGRSREQGANRLGGRREFAGERLIYHAGHVAHPNCLGASHHSVTVAVPATFAKAPPHARQCGSRRPAGALQLVANDGNNASMSVRLRQVAWTAAALFVPAVLSVALLPLRPHVDDVLVAVVLLAVSSAALARAEWPPRLVAAASAALSFNFFYAQPYDRFGGGIQAIETTVVLAVAVPVLAAWVGRLSGQEAAREKMLREQAERTAAELAERQRQVERLAADLAASRRRIVAAGDEMRRRIERNLHDGVQQRLVTLSLKLGGVRDRVPDSLPANIQDPMLLEAWLGSALRGLARRSALPVRLHVHVDGRLPAESEATAYYVVSEAFTNAVKHASASAVDIGVEAAEGTLTVQVSDDGVGGADASCGSGLTGIRDRVEAVGGTLAVHSPPGSGTVLTARLPPGDPFG